MKATTLGLLAVSTFALAMPFTANASLSATVFLNDTKLGSFSGGTYTIGSALVDGDIVAVNIKGSPSAAYDTFFTVASDSTLYGSKVFGKAASGVTVSLTGTGVTGGWNAIDGQYEFTGLKAGQTYDWKTTGTVTGSNGTFGSQFTVTAVPEPEEWAMMLLGAGLVGYQVRRKQKALVA